MNNPLVSIIIPVYNSEQYLNECIISLLNQTLKNCEFIFVNDGSTDNSREIINKYKQSDNRIKLIEQENQGVSVARNRGLNEAIGDYIGFVDADDYVKEDMYELLYNMAEAHQSDLVISNFEQQIEGKRIVDTLDIKTDILIEKEKMEKEIIPQFLCHEKLNPVWNKLYKKSVIEMFNVRFPCNVCLGEDRFFNINYFSNIKSLMYTHYCGYHYREVEGSATRNVLEKDYFKRALEIYNEKLPFSCFETMDKVYVKKLQTEKFINNVISYSYIYSNPNSGLDFKTRYQYLKNMVDNPDVRYGVKIYISNFYSKKSLYEKLMIRFIKLRFVFGIQFLTAYSRFRCR